MPGINKTSLTNIKELYRKHKGSWRNRPKLGGGPGQTKRQKSVPDWIFQFGDKEAAENFIGDLGGGIANPRVVKTPRGEHLVYVPKNKVAGSFLPFKKEVIAVLLNAGRHDLANAFSKMNG